MSSIKPWKGEVNNSFQIIMIGDSATKNDTEFIDIENLK